MCAGAASRNRPANGELPDNADLEPLFEAILEHVPAPHYDDEAPLQAWVTNLDSSPFLGRLALLRVFNGTLRKGQTVAWVRHDGSHANARTVCEHPRNLPDEVIKAVAASGGVIGLCAFPSFVSAGPKPALNQLIDHAVHIASLVGAKHVGLGLDFADEGEEEYDFYGYDEAYYPRPPWAWPRGIEWLHQSSDISPALQARGFSPDEATGIMGMNFLRVLTTIWGS